MKKLLTTISVLAVLLLITSTLGFAAQDSATTTVGWTINAQQSLQISSNGSSSTKTAESVYVLPEPTEADIEKGFIKETNAIELTARSNVGWEVQVKAASRNFTTNTDYEKPVSDLSVKGMGGFEEVSTNPTTIADGKPGEFTFSLDYKAQYDEDYVEGDYQVRLFFTITTA